jgi:integrase/recombinase XerD
MTKKARTLSDTRINEALDAADTTRNRLIVALSIMAGLRACEIAGLKWEDIDWKDRTMQLKVTKGGKPRQVPISKNLLGYLLEHWGDENAPEGGYIIRNPNTKKPVTANAIAQWLRRHYEKLEWEGYSSHSGRRTFVTRAAQRIKDAGGTMKDIQALVGHADIRTTAGYIDTDENAQRKLVDLI